MDVSDLFEIVSRKFNNTQIMQEHIHIGVGYNLLCTAKMQDLLHVTGIYDVVLRTLRSYSSCRDTTGTTSCTVKNSI